MFSGVAFAQLLEENQGFEPVVAIPVYVIVEKGAPTEGAGKINDQKSFCTDEHVTRGAICTLPFQHVFTPCMVTI